MSDIVWSVDTFTGYQGATALDASGVEWVVLKSTGWWESPATRSDDVARLGHGSYPGQVYKGDRVVSISGFATAPGEAEMFAAMDSINAVLGDGVQYPLSVSVGSDTRTAMVKLATNGVALEPFSPTVFDYQLTVIASDPRKHGVAATSSTFLPVDPVGGLDATTGLNATTGLDAGTSPSLGLVTVTNPGRAPAFPLIVFSGGGAPLVYPSLTDQATGAVLTYRDTIAADSSVYINCDDFPYLGFPEKSVLLGGTADRGNLLSLIGGWPMVGPGETRTYAFRATTGNAFSTAALTLRPAHW